MPTQRTDREILLQIYDDVREIKTKMDEVSRTLWGHEDSMGLVGRVAVTEDKVDDHRERIKKLEELAPAMKVVIWIGGVLGVSVIGLIFAILTGQVTMALN